MELRKHQAECIENIEDNFLKNNKGLIKMFCGSGKSFIIYNCLLKYCEQLSILVVPSINLVTQFNNDYFLNSSMVEYNKTHFGKKYNLMSICSKDETEKQTQMNLITTDKYEINEFITDKSNAKVLLVTYQSLPNLIDIIKEDNIQIDIICFDEAHHILGENTSKLLFSKSSNFIDDYVKKTLFFTATPKNTKDYKMYDNLTELVIDNNDYNIIDNINEENYDTSVCGPLVYEYSHMDGVSDNILNDFNIRIELYNENQNSNIFETISRAILETGNNRILTFHSRSSTKSINSSDVLSFSNKENQALFKAVFHRILHSEFPQLINKYKNLKLKGITAQTKNKITILNEFDATKDDDIFIISSCKTIGEGVDTKNANMVCFVDPKQSYIEIIQNIGRICRKNKTTNKLSTVLIPCYVNIDKYNTCATHDEIDHIIRSEMSISGGDFNGILSVLSSLRQEDPYMFELCLKYPNTYTNNEFKRQFKKFNLILDDNEYAIEDLFNQYDMLYDDKISLKDNLNALSGNLEKNIKIFCKNIHDKNIRINNKYELDECFIKTENGNYIKVLGKKERDTHVPRPNRNIKPFLRADDKIKVLWDIDKINGIDLSKKIFGCFIKSTVVANTKELWLEMYNTILNDTVDNMSKYSSWIKKNKHYYKNNIGLFKNPDIKKLWETIKDDEKKGVFFYSNVEKWYINLEDCRSYLNDMKLEDCKSPTFNVGDWIHRNVKNYRNNKSLMLNNEIKQEWELFMNDKTYYNSFKTYIYTSDYNKDYWKNKLNLVLNSNNILQKVNLDDKHRSNQNLTDDERDAFWLLNEKNDWICKNNRLFENKSEIMESNEIYMLWNEFKNNHEFIVNKSIEDKQTQIELELKEYIDEINKFKHFLDNQSERTIPDYSFFIRCQNKMVWWNRDSEKCEIWLKLVSCEKYKKFYLSIEDDFYFHLNIFKKYYDKEIILTEEQLEYLCGWDNYCFNHYRTKRFEMNNENIRNDYSRFAIQYKNRGERGQYRYTKCGKKTLEKQMSHK
jgi:superfamily II DNA or RNA helicase